MEISLKVKQLRESKGWSQEHLAAVAGISPRTIHRIETGKRKASLESQRAIASAFEISVSDLIYDPLPNQTKSWPKEYILEVYFEGECIEQQRYLDPIIPPLPGEKFYIVFENKNYSDEHGNWWIVNRRRHLKFNEEINIETLMLDCTPDPQNGV